MEILNEVHTPIGTLAELFEIGADPKKVRSCSQRTTTNLGCPNFRSCRFRQWRDQQSGLKGPLNLGVEITLAQVDGRHTGQMEMACYQYYESNTRQRQKQMEDTGELIRIVAYEGDGRSITEWGTEHADGDLKSPKMNRVANVHEVSRHPRPIERFPVVAAANQATHEMMDDVEREALRNVLAKAGLTMSGAQIDGDVAPPVVGKPVKVPKEKDAA